MSKAPKSEDVQNSLVEPLSGMWRTEDRLRTDDATIALLFDLAGRDAAIGEVICDLRSPRAGNGSVWATGTVRRGRTPAVLKLGARRSERDWMSAVDAALGDVVPRVFGSGEMRGVGWLVLEWCPFTLDRSSPAHVSAVVAATARYHLVAETVSADLPAMNPGWLRDHLEAAQALHCPGDLAPALDGLEASWAFVEAQCGLGPTHGDVHLTNAVARDPDGPALLIDPMPIRTVWAWDAAYLDATLGPYGRHRPSSDASRVRELARRRALAGLPTAEQLLRVERLVLGWAAALWWRIAPWRHDNDIWRDWVQRRIRGLTE